MSSAKTVSSLAIPVTLLPGISLAEMKHTKPGTLWVSVVSTELKKGMAQATEYYYLAFTLPYKEVHMVYYEIYTAYFSLVLPFVQLFTCAKWVENDTRSK